MTYNLDSGRKADLKQIMQTLADPNVPAHIKQKARRTKANILKQTKEQAYERERMIRARGEDKSEKADLRAERLSRLH